MKRVINSIIFFAIILIMIFAIKYVLDYRNEFFRDILAIIGIVLLFLIILFLIFQFENTKRIFGGIFFGDLKKTIEIFLGELPKPQNKTIASLSSQLIYRFTRLGVIGLIISFIPIWLLYNQNKILTKQNLTIENQSKLMEKQSSILEIQNDRIYQQNLLQEASRRNNLQFEISSILDLIDQELKNDYNKNGKRDLSPELEGRIIALNSRLEPYYFIEGKNLIDKPLSQERGQLLISLINSKLEKSAFKNIVKRMDLKNIDLRNLTVVDADLSDIDFIEAEFSNAKFINSNLSGTYFRDSNLSRASFKDCKMIGLYTSSTIWESTYFENTDFSKSEVFRCDFTNSTFKKVILDSLHIDPIEFVKAKFDSVTGFGKMYHSNNGVNFREAELIFSNNNNIPQIFTFLSNCNLDKTSIRNDSLISLFKEQPENYLVVKGNGGIIIDDKTILNYNVTCLNSDDGY